VSVIIHLVWHDIRALRLPLAAWLALLLTQAAVMALGPAHRSGGAAFVGDSIRRPPRGREVGVHRPRHQLARPTRLAVGTTAFW